MLSIYHFVTELWIFLMVFHSAFLDILHFLLWHTSSITRIYIADDVTSLLETVLRIYIADDVTSLLETVLVKNLERNIFLILSFRFLNCYAYTDATIVQNSIVIGPQKITKLANQKTIKQVVCVVAILKSWKISLKYL